MKEMITLTLRFRLSPWIEVPQQEASSKIGMFEVRE